MCDPLFSCIETLSKFLQSMHLRCGLCKRRGDNGDWAWADGSVAACSSGGFRVALPIDHLWGKVYIAVGAEGSGQKKNEGDPGLCGFFCSQL
ncbi:hypothetical protein M405DRAFT_814145 [Rhizopogon salebrosus TDB-379]|nr:hypothetical protein M405DRAFT_814145 [Rhizopogon salebrosus TDB-379]